MNRLLPLLFLCLPGLAAAVPILLPHQGRIFVGDSAHSGTGYFKFALVSEPLGSQQATATPILSNGYLFAYTIENGGSGYTSPPAITITDSSGTGASASATIVGGSVTEINMISPGDGNYSETPTVSIDPPQSATYQTYWSHDGTSSAGGEPSSAIALEVSDGVYAVTLGDTILSNMQALPGSVFANDALYLRIWFSDGVNGFERLQPDQRLGSVAFAARSATADAVAAGAIDDTALSDDAVTAGKIADGAVGSSAIAGGAVGTGQLSAGAVTSDRLAAGAVTSDKLADDAVTSARIADGSITSAKLASGSVTAEAIDNRALDSAGSPLGRVLVGPGTSGGGTRFILVSDLPPADFAGHDTGAGRAAVADGGKVHILAGTSPDTVEGIFVYDSDLGSWTTGAALSTPRRAAAALTVNGKIYLVGGEDADSPGNYPSDVRIYDPTSASWSTGAAFPQPRAGLALLAKGGTLYAIAGENAAGFSSAVHAYDLAADGWSTHSSLPLGLARPGAIVFDNILAIAGGESAGGLLDRGYWYDPVSGQWQALPAQTEASEARLRPQMLGIEEAGNELRGVFVVGGINTDGDRSKAVDYFRRGHDFNVVPANGGNRPAYSGALYKDRSAYFFGGSSLWRAQAVPTREPGEFLPALRREPGDAAYWRNRLNATPTLDLTPDYRLALLQLDTVSAAPQIQITNEETIPFNSQGDSVSLNFSGDASLYATNLPAGLTLDRNTGVLSGTPNQRGSFDIDLIAVGPAGSDAISVTVEPSDVEVTIAPTAEFSGGPTSALVTTDPSGLSTSVTYGGSATPPSSLGTHAVEVTVTAAGYSGNATGSYEIVERALTIAADDLSKLEGEADPTLTYTVANLPPGVPAASVVSGSLTRSNGETPGTYAISQGSLAPTSGYSIDSFLPGSFTVENFASYATIPAGIFTRGDTRDPGDNDAQPAHEVGISEFEIQTTEVTYRQLVSIFNWALGQQKAEFVSNFEGQDVALRMASFDSEGEKRLLILLEGGATQGILQSENGALALADFFADRPARNLTWYGAMAYSHWLNQRDGVSSAVDIQDWTIDLSQPGFRPPTEAEWEKAARGGLVGKIFPWGDVITPERANYGSNSVSWDPTLGVAISTTPVGSYPANSFGLYDMAGNVAEWVYDRWAGYPEHGEVVYDPTGPSQDLIQNYRVKRGGSFSGDPSRQTVFDRDFDNPQRSLPSSYGYADVGFRPARSLP